GSPPDGPRYALYRVRQRRCLEDHECHRRESHVDAAHGRPGVALHRCSRVRPDRRGARHARCRDRSFQQLPATRGTSHGRSGPLPRTPFESSCRQAPGRRDEHSLGERFPTTPSRRAHWSGAQPGPTVANDPVPMVVCRAHFRGSRLAGSGPRGARTWTMDAAYFSAFAALAGSVIGGLTSLGTSWLTQHSQLGAQRFARNLERRETLYKDFINEASRLYADAFEHDQTELANLVKLFAMISQMRIVSAPRIAPNKTFGDFEGTIQSHTVDPLRLFSEACRDEMQQLGAF